MGELARWLATVDTLRKLLAMGDPDIANLVLVLSSPNIEAAVVAATLDAFQLGAGDALRIVEAAGYEDVVNRGRPSLAAREPARGLDNLGREALATAQRLISGGAPIEAVLAPIFAHAVSVRARISDAITRAGNEGATAIADRVGLPTVWVAETNACVTCLAYSGRVANPGKTFPSGLTYGKRSTVSERLDVPPAHPHCRCTVEPLNDPSYAAALRREADRSVLRGFSLPSESMSVRIDAARRLLDRGVSAPKSVIAYARRQVKAGSFPTRGRPASR
ncbi:MAG: hypothetical protein ABWZ99_18260 [Ilumatobacteraceae bacterium]